MDCARSKASLWVMSLLLAMGHLSVVQGQSIQAPTQPDDLQQEKLRLLADVQGLVARAKQLEKPLARGTAEA
jgi:hypothetical protein